MSREARGLWEHPRRGSSCVCRFATQLRPSGQSDGDDGAEWLSGLWNNDVHTPVVSTFLMSVKATRMFATLDAGREPSAEPRLVLSLEVPKQYEQVSEWSSTAMGSRQSVQIDCPLGASGAAAKCTWVGAAAHEPWTPGSFGLPAKYPPRPAALWQDTRWKQCEDFSVRNRRIWGALL